LFEGQTISETLAAVLTKAPDYASVPPKAQRVLRACLERDPKRRLRDIADAWLLLDDPALPAASGSRLQWAGAAALTVALAITVAFWAPWRGARPSTGQPSMRLDLDLGPGISLGGTIGPASVISLDGRRLVFASQIPGQTSRLYTRRLDQPAAVEMPGTEGAYNPFFSPDGQWIGFFARGKLRKTRVDGGEPLVLCDAYAARGAGWGDDGYIVAALDAQAPLSMIPAEGGKPAPLTDLNGEIGEFSHRFPQFLPGSNAVVFTASARYANFEDAPIAVVSLKNRKAKIVVQRGGMLPRYLPTGHLMYVSKGVAFAVPFDLEKLEARGNPIKLVEEEFNQSIAGFAQLDVSSNGILVFLAGKAVGQTTIQWGDAKGDGMNE
jgi:hypothetical protein